MQLEESQFQELPGEMANGRSSSVCQTFKTAVVVVAGLDSNWKPMSSVEVYNTEEGLGRPARVYHKKNGFSLRTKDSFWHCTTIFHRFKCIAMYSMIGNLSLLSLTIQYLKSVRN